MVKDPSGHIRPPTTPTNPPHVEDPIGGNDEMAPGQPNIPDPIYDKTGLRTNAPNDNPPPPGWRRAVWVVGKWLRDPHWPF